MRRLVWCLLVVVSVAPAWADSDVAAIHAEIDRTVWKTFQHAFESMDGDALNSVYADNVLRATPEGIDTQNEFKQTNRTRFAANVANGDQIALDFWFDSRRTEATTSYDVGFYRVRITNASGATNTFYGQFHIVLKKLEGSWKIVQDWDTGSIGGRAISAADFERQQPVRF